MKSILIIATANIRHFVRNRSFVIIGLLAPFLIMAALGATIGAAIGGGFQPNIILAGPGPVIDAFADGLTASGFENVIRQDDTAGASELVDDGSADVAIVVPPSLATLAATDSETAITVIAAQGSETAAQVGKDIATSLAMTLDTLQVTQGTTAATDQANLILPPAIGPDIGSRVLNDSTYFAVGMSAYFALITTASFLATYHKERAQLTLDRMLSAPIARFNPLAGKLLAAAALTLVSFGVLVISSTLLLGADWGRPVGVMAIALGTIMASVGASTAVVTFTTTEQAAYQAGTVLATAWAIFGGVFIEIPRSGPLSAISNLSPFTWTFRAVGSNAGIGSLGEVLSMSAVSAAFGVVGLAIAFARRSSVGVL